MLEWLDQVGNFLFSQCTQATDLLGEASEFRHLSQHCWIFYELRLTIFAIIAGVVCICGYLAFKGMAHKRSVSFRARLINVKEVTYDTKIFTFDLPADMKKVDLNIG